MRDTGGERWPTLTGQRTLDSAPRGYRGAVALYLDGVAIHAAPLRHSPMAIHELAALVAEQGHRDDALHLFEIASLDAARFPDLQAAVHRDGGRGRALSRPSCLRRGSVGSVTNSIL